VGLGGRSALDAVIVEWPGGLVERFAPVPPDALITLKRGAGQPRPPPGR
jgi:hypothetical protein